MSGTGKVGTAVDETVKKNRFVLEIEDNSVLYAVLEELQKIRKHLECITGESFSDY